MTLRKTIEDREWDKFECDDEGQTRVRTIGEVTGELAFVGLQKEGKFTELSITNTGWTIVPYTAQTGPRSISIHNPSSEEVKLNWTNSPAGYVGMPIPANGGERQYVIQSSSIFIYLKSSTSVVNVYIEDLV